MLALLIVCNVLAWKIIRSPVEYHGLLTLYSRSLEYSTEYRILLPRWEVFSPLASHVLSLLIGVALPFAVLWLWRRKEITSKVSYKNASGNGRKLPVGGSVLALLMLLILLNVLAWDWVSTDDKASLYIVLGQEQRTYRQSVISLDVTQYTGIAPGIRFQDKGVSIAASFFVGEILPFLLAPTLFRRRQSVALPLPPVAGAPR